MKTVIKSQNLTGVKMELGHFIFVFDDSAVGIFSFWQEGT